MADYNVNFTRLQSYISPPTQILEAAGVRYCVVGETFLGCRTEEPTMSLGQLLKPM
jgi:hypothetical protein